MGAADIVPGISGGTIALILGIYEEFISTIKSFRPTVLISFAKRLINPTEQNRAKFKADFLSLNPGFIIPLGLGIVVAIAIGSRIIPSMMDNYPVHTFSFFIGLIIVSIKTPFNMIKKISPTVVFLLIIGTVFAWQISVMTPSSAEIEDIGLFYLFFSGFIGISAMLLPGISGSYILLVLGVYRPVLTLLNLVMSSPASMITLDGLRLLLFIMGLVSGLMVFSRLLTRLLKGFRDQTLAVLTGFLTGALIKPYQEINLENMSDNLPVIILFITLGIAVVVCCELAKNILEKKQSNKPKD